MNAERTDRDLQIAVISVPFDGYGRPGHQARAAEALISAGLLESVAATTSEQLTLPPPDLHRGPATSLINERALLAQTSQLSDAVARLLAKGAFPLVVGGDTEIGILLGVTGRGLPAPLHHEPPTLSPARLALLGARDEDWRRGFNVGSVSGLGAFCADASAVSRAPRETAAAAVRFVGGDGWWLHVDVDVLDPLELPAQGLPDVPDEPGGLTIEQLQRALHSATGEGGCIGMSIAIYDPEQDPDGSCADVTIDLVASAVRARKA